MIKFGLADEEKSVRIVLWAMFVAATASILFTRQTGVDYLYYYLPVADFLFTQGMPKIVSTSVLDAPFGYPSAEYWLLGATAVFGEYRAYVIKLIQCLKVAAVFGLGFRLAATTSRVNGFLLPVALIAPSAVAFFSVYSTDINSIIGLLAILLILSGRDRSTTLWLLVAYAALSKYTFWLFLPPFYLLLWRVRTFRWVALLPVMFVGLHLASNFHYFGNPVFPVGSKPDSALPAEVAQQITSWSRPNSDWLAYIASGFLAGGGVLAILTGRPWFWYPLVGLYVVGWAYAMQADTASDTGRFLLPVSIGAACLASAPRMSRWSTALYAVVMALCCMYYIKVRHSTPVYYPLLAAFVVALVCASASKPWRFVSYAVVLSTFLVYSAARLYLKFDLSNDLGYSQYRSLIEEVEAGARIGIVITDFPRLPHDVRLRPNVILWGSEVYGPIFRRIAITSTFNCEGRPLKLLGSARFFDAMQRLKFEDCSYIDMPEMR